MEGALDHLQLLLAAQAVEVHGVAGHADGQRRILFRMLHSVQQDLAVHHVHVQMVRALRLTPEQLNAMLSGGTVPGMAAASADYNEQEDTAHEE